MQGFIGDFQEVWHPMVVNRWGDAWPRSQRNIFLAQIESGVYVKGDSSSWPFSHRDIILPVCWSGATGRKCSADGMTRWSYSGLQGGSSVLKIYRITKNTELQCLRGLVLHLELFRILSNSNHKFQQKECISLFVKEKPTLKWKK